MLELTEFHPVVVHFAVSLCLVGVVLRLTALTGKVPWANAAAITLLLAGGLATVFAVESGQDAHGPAERIPGVRDLVQEHQALGERTRNLFLVVAGLEALGALLTRSRHRGALRLASAGVGIVGVFTLLHAARHGGELVYSYAGGVGTWKSEAADVERLLVAGLYHQAQNDRAEGRPDAAGRLIQELLRRRPDDPEVRVLSAESMLLDWRDPPAAGRAVQALRTARLQGQLGLRVRVLGADVLEALGQEAAARDSLEALRVEFPDSPIVLERLGGGGGEGG